MRKYLLAATAAAAVVATPALARDGSVYGGIEGGIMFPRDQNADVFIDYTTTQTIVTNPMVVGQSDTTFNNAFGINYKRDIDADVILGYDFGMFRLEGELGYKRAGLKDFGVNNAFIASLNSALNRPSGVGDPGAPGLAALSNANFDVGGSVKVYSAMVNGLFDFGNQDGLSFYAGGGVGRARVKFAGDRDNAWAFQGIAGVRYAINRHVDIGLKYRYFQTGRLNLNEDPIAITGNPRCVRGWSHPDGRDDQCGAVLELRAEVPVAQLAGEPDLQLRWSGADGTSSPAAAATAGADARAWLSPNGSE